MSLLQIVSIAFAFLAAPVLWLINRRRPQPGFDHFAARTLAVLLAAAFLAGPLQRQFEGQLDIAHLLPMHLCDWTLVAVVFALLLRFQTAFELSYFWGLSGTVQALITPAISSDIPWWKQAVFFLDHALIVASVLFLLLVCRMRPRGLWRTLLWSEIYLCAALAANALTGGNYGFLARKPATPSLLDFLSDDPWLYVAEINGVAILFFLASYLPWLIADRIRERRASSAFSP